MEDLKKLVGQRITEAREASGLTQQRAAELLEIDRPRLSGMENGERPIDITMLSRLANLYGLNMAALVSGGDTEQHSQAVQLRSALATRLDDGEVRTELRGFVGFAERYARLLREAEFVRPEPDLFRREGSRSRHKYEIEGDAEKLRSLWELDDTPVGLGIFDLLDDHGIDAYREPLAETKISGAYLEVPELGSLIFINARDWPYRQVFTAAHELAHLIYHRGGGVSYKGDTTVAEKLANEFASAFLMPAAAIKQHLADRADGAGSVTLETVIDLHRHFGVSFAAMLVRLRRLNIIGAKVFEAFKDTQPVRLALDLGYRVAPWEFGYTPEDVPTAARLSWLPRSYRRLVRHALSDNRISDRQAAKMLNLEYEDWAALQNGREADAELLEDDLDDAESTIR